VVNYKICCVSPRKVNLKPGLNQMLYPPAAGDGCEPFLYQPKVAVGHGGGSSSSSSVLTLYAWCGLKDCGDMVAGDGDHAGEREDCWQPEGWRGRGCPARNVSLWRSRPLSSVAQGDGAVGAAGPSAGGLMATPSLMKCGAAVSPGEGLGSAVWEEVYGWGDMAAAAVHAAAERQKRDSRREKWWRRWRYKGLYGLQGMCTRCRQRHDYAAE
jgi:hypothetical protein